MIMRVYIRENGPLHVLLTLRRCDLGHGNREFGPLFFPHIATPGNHLRPRAAERVRVKTDCERFAWHLTKDQARADPAFPFALAVVVFRVLPK